MNKTLFFTYQWCDFFCLQGLASAVVTLQTRRFKTGFLPLTNPVRATEPPIAIGPEGASMNNVQGLFIQFDTDKKSCLEQLIGSIIYQYAID